MHAHFSGLAASYNELRTTDLEPILFVKEVLGERQSLRAIDVACGGGRYSLLLCQHLPGLELTLHDVNESMLSGASRYLRENGITQFTTIAADIAHLKVQNEGLDAVFTFNAIHHFDPQLLMDKASQALTVGGHLFIYTRLRSQNARTIWGRYFPNFADREDRLYRPSEIESWKDDAGRLGVADVHHFRYRRSASLSDLLRQVRGRHYSTFSLYSDAALDRAITTFERTLRDRFPDPEHIEWADENIMVVYRKAGR